MHEYDIALKTILTRKGATALSRLTGLEVARWHNAELPEVRALRADLLGEGLDATLIHVELQSSNDQGMALRMLEYAVAIYKGFGRFPRQVVLYVGEAPVRMNERIETTELSFRCRVVDIREMDSEPLLSSDSLGDNVVSILTRTSGEIRPVRRILERIAGGDPALRAGALAELLIIAGLRSLVDEVKKEIERMPILNDIMDHSLFGPMIRTAQAQGKATGERTVILSLIGKRFGPVPDWAGQRLESLSAPELEALALRLLDATSLEDLFA